MDKFPMKTDSIQVKGKAKNGKVKVVKYDRSFLSRIIQNEKAKRFYDEVKNYCLSFERVKVRSAWGAESFLVGSESVVRFVYLGGSLCVLLALSPSAYSQKDYPHGDISAKREYASTPLLVPVRSAAEIKIARRLIAEAFTRRCVYTQEFPSRADYVAALPAQKDETLIKKNMIKVSESEMSEADAKKAIASSLQTEAEEEKFLEEIGSGKKKRAANKQKQEEIEPAEESAEAAIEEVEFLLDEPIEDEREQEDLTEAQNASSDLEEGVIEEQEAEKTGKEEPVVEEPVAQQEEIVNEEPIELQEEIAVEEPIAIQEENAEEELSTAQEEKIDEAEVAPQEENVDEEDVEFVEDTEDDVEDTVFELASDGLVIEIKYDRSFIARITQNEKAKRYYDEIKNYALSFGVKPRLSWKADSFYLGRTTYFLAKVRGKTLSLYLALDPKAHEENIWHHLDVSDKKTYEKTPMMVRVKSDLGLRKAKKLIEEMLTAASLTQKETPRVDYIAMYPYEETDALIEKRLIKRFERHLDAEESAMVLERKEVKEEKRDQEPKDLTEDVVFELAEDEEEEMEDVVFELEEDEEDEPEEVVFESLDEEEEEDVTFELVEEPAEEDKSGMESYGKEKQEGRFVTLKKYMRGFQAKMRQGDETRKDYYAEIKAKLLSYKGVKLSESFSGDSYKKGARALLKTRIRGKTLCLFFALNPDNYKQTVYRQQYKGDTKAYASTPMMVRVKSEQGLKRALRLIEEMERNYMLQAGERVDPIKVRGEFLFEETASLVEKKLIKTRLITVTAFEAELLLRKKTK